MLVMKGDLSSTFACKISFEQEDKGSDNIIVPKAVLVRSPKWIFPHEGTTNLSKTRLSGE